MKDDFSGAAQRPPRYFVRFSNADDLGKILEYYSINPHSSVVDRRRELMTELSKRGSVTLIEDEQGSIVGSSVSYPLDVESDGGKKTRWVEVGSTRMTLNGYPGLFNVLIGMQVLRAFLADPPEDRLVAEMKDAPVQNLARGLGWRPLENPSRALVRQSYAILNDKAQESYNNWFSHGLEGLPLVARRLLEVIDSPLLQNKKTGQAIEVSFEKSPMVKIFLPVLRDLAEKDFGPVDSPDYDKGLRDQRRRWLLSLR